MPYLRASIIFLVAGYAFAAPADTLIDNDQVRVIKITDEPHQKSQPHDHKLNRVMVYLQSGTQEIDQQGGKKVTQHFRAGEVKWSPAGGMHTSEVTSSSPVTIIELEIKKPGDPNKSINTPLDPLKVDPKDVKLEFENPQVRVARVHIPAHATGPMHEHVLNRVVVYLTDQDGTMTSPDGKTTPAQHKAGEASWGGPVKHKEANLMDHAFEGLMIELKD